MGNRIVVDKDKVRENRLRRKAARLGVLVRKSRGKYWSLNNQLGYLLLDPYKNFVLVGGNYDLNLDDVEEFLDYYEEKLIEESNGEMN